MEEMSDAELVAQAQTGQQQAVAQLYRRHRPSIFRYTLAKVRDYQQAQDLTGEIFLRMVDHLPHYQMTGAPFTAWLFRIAHNHVISVSQKEARYQNIPIEEVEIMTGREDNPAMLVEKQLELEWLLAGLNHIDAKQREAVILRFLAGLSLKEVAHVLDRSIGSVKTLQHRGVLALRVALKQTEGGKL